MNSANGGDILFHFKGDTSGLDNSLKSVSGGMKGMTKSILAATGITKAFSMTMNLITGSTDQAISRLDTLNQFPKVMSNLGIGAEEAQESIEKMSQKLQGLPTTLDEGALAVQRFTSKNGDVKKSTDMFLALNNAILAGGANSQIQSNAIEQLSQAYAKGKMDMMEWRSIQTAMPAQLKQIASAMGMSTEQMGIFLREGDQTAEFMEEFMQTLQNLNVEGANGFLSFEEQARNSTGGIQTAITVMKTRVAQGMAELIKSVDVGLKDFGGLTGVLTTIGDTLKAGLKSLAPYIISTIQFLSNNLPSILSALKTIGLIILPIVSAFKIYSTTVKIITTITKAWAIAQALLNGTLVLNPVGLIVTAIIALIATIVLLWNKCEWFRNFVIGMWEGIKILVKSAIKIFQSIVEKVSSAVKSIIKVLSPIMNFIVNLVVNYINFYINVIKTVVNGLVAFIKNPVETIGFIVGYVVGKIFKKVSDIIAFIQSIPEKVGAFIDSTKAKITQFFTNVWNFLTITLPAIFNYIVITLKQLPGHLWNIFLQTIDRVKQWLREMYEKVSSGIINVVNGIKQWFRDLPKNMLNIGKNIVKGLWEGIKNAKDWLMGKIKDFVGGFTKGFKKALKIGSPSKLMSDQIGQWIPKGIAIGINANTDSVYKAMKNMENEISTSFGLNPSLTGAMNTHYSPNIVVNNNVSMETDPLGQTVSRIKTFSGGAKNDYNYGMGG